VQRAFVVARDGDGARTLAYVDVAQQIEVDRGWYRGSGLRASESHRVVFDRAPVLALAGADELLREPWFSRDGVRTSATWAGLADCIVAASAAVLAHGPADDVRRHALGRMRVAQGTIDRWLEHAGTALDGQQDRSDAGPLRTLAAACRIAVSDAARAISALAAQACGSRALVGGGPLDRARRDLDLFLLQHRLDPKLVELGADLLQEYA
jgi:alkylation response protein AidB-like acyl-CoA dehydrogenase